MEPLARLRKKKDRHLIVISAASVRSGVQCLSLHAGKDRWDVPKHLFTPYPQDTREAIDAVTSGRDLRLSELARLDWRLSRFFLDCATSLIGQLPRTRRAVDLIVLNRLVVWKGTVGDEPTFWNIPVGDPQLLASRLAAPVLMDFIRHSLLSGEDGALPTAEGDLRIASGLSPAAVFLNLGLNAHISIVDTVRRTVPVSTECGPAAAILDAAARAAGCIEGFDRDGTSATTGNVDTEVLEAMVSDGWLERIAPSRGAAGIAAFLADSRMATLRPADALATITALVARAIANAYRKLYTLEERPQAIWVSGGAANNQALLEYLAAYVSPVPVRSVEELGVPSDSRLPVALGLSVTAFIEGQPLWTAGAGPSVPPGKWVLP